MSVDVLAHVRERALMVLGEEPDQCAAHRRLFSENCVSGVVVRRAGAARRSLEHVPADIGELTLDAEREWLFYVNAGRSRERLDPLVQVCERDVFLDRHARPVSDIGCHEQRGAFIGSARRGAAGISFPERQPGRAIDNRDPTPLPPSTAPWLQSARSMPWNSCIMRQGRCISCGSSSSS